MSLEAFYTLVRFAHFVATMLMCGMSIFVALLCRGQFNHLLSGYLKKGIILSAVVTVFTTFAWLVAQAGLMGDGWEDALDIEIWQGVLGTAFGQIWRWELAFSIILFISLFVRHDAARQYIILILSIILLGLHALIGHAAMYDGLIGTLQRLNQFIHLISSAYWFGGLWPFIICVQFLQKKVNLTNGVESQILTTMIRFSRLGHLAVGLVIVTGVISAMILLPNWPLSASFSEYQTLLWGKIGLVIGMVLLAIVNRYWVVPNIRHKGRVNYLIINSWMELLLGTAAILVVAIFATYQPI